MAAPVYPSVPKTLGTGKCLFTPTADPAAPSLATISGTGSLDISGYLQSWAPTGETNKGTAPRRVGETRQFESFGITTESVADLVYVWAPQAAEGADEKKAYETLLEGTLGYFVERLGTDADTDLAIGDFVRVIPVECGYQNPTPLDTGDEFAEYTITQSIRTRSPGFGPFVALAA